MTTNNDILAGVKKLCEALHDAHTELYGYSDAGWSNKAAHICDQLKEAIATAPALLERVRGMGEPKIGKEQSLATWVRTSERMPEPNGVVIVEGGLATWTGSVWLSKTGNDSGRVIQWPVTYWTLLITPPLMPPEPKP